MDPLNTPFRHNITDLDGQMHSISASSDETDYQRMLEKLNAASLRKRYDAYLDIPWEDANFQISRNDSRWQLSDTDALGSTSWYRSLPEPQRIALALDRTAVRVKTGIIFENTLIRGMLEFALTLPNRAPEFRYALHECIEEAQHSLMFQEFVNRSGSDPTGLSFGLRMLTRYIIRQGSTCPPLFFLFVLGGEEPIDYDQRMQLQQKNLHPLMRRIDQIHVTEEARHICFANAYLHKYVPKLSPFQRLKVRLLAPFILGNIGKLFLHPPKSVIKRYQIPASVIKAAYKHNAAQKQEWQHIMAPLCGLCQKLGILTEATAPLWRWFDLIPNK
jgi:hypothetical protein